MIATIAPLVQVASPRTFWRAWLGHFFSAAIGGAALGGLVGSVGLVLSPGPTGFAVASALTFAYAAHELRIISIPVLSVPTAVPFEWREKFGRVRAAWVYGFSLGLGFTARTPFPSFHLMLIWLVTLADVSLASGIGAIYGMSRAIAPLATYAIWPDGERHAERALAVARDPKVVHALNGVAVAVLGGMILAQVAAGL